MTKTTTFTHRRRTFAVRKSSTGTFLVFLVLGRGRGMTCAGESTTDKPADLRATADRGWATGEI